MSYQAERNLISSLLTDCESVNKICDTLKPEMFTCALFGAVYKQFIIAADQNKVVTLDYLFQKLCIEDESISAEDLVSVFSLGCLSVEVRTNAEVIVDDYKSRKLNEFLSSIRITPNNYKEKMVEISEQIDIFSEKKSDKTKTLAEIAAEYKNKYFCEKEEDNLCIGFPRLDDMLGGLEGGDIVVIGARPAVGKSAFVTQITSNLAASGKKIGFYNLEMQDKQVYERFVVNHSGIGLTRLRRATTFLGDEKERFDKAHEIIEKAENIVITTGSKSIGEIRRESKHAEYDVIIIDYLQLIKPDSSNRGNRYAEVGDISRAMKALAMELKIPIIVLSQLNRGSEMRDDREPTMAELRESGDIEQDASVIMLLWNLSKDNSIKKGCKIEKNRQGKVGKIVMNFNGDLMRFEESSEDVNTAKKWKEPTPEDDCPFD